MESISTELFDILKFLLPGFLTAWIFHAFTAYPKPSQFERVVQALIFIMIIQGAILLIKPSIIFAGKYLSFGEWDETTHIVWLYIISIMTGVIFSYFANNDKFHNLLRRLRITKQTSYHCEWYGAFHDRENSRVILTLTDERRIYGWPHEWPSDPSKGHFVLTEAAWIDNESQYIVLAGVNAIMFKVSEIKWIEFLEEEE